MSNRFTNRYPALGYPMYRRYWLASFASVGATQLITLGQAWLIFELTGSALQLGLLGAAAAVPNILMTLLGGVIADRLDKRLILITTSAFLAALLILLTVLDYTGAVAVWHVLAIAASVSLITGLDWPTRVSLFPHLVERSAFLSAVALNSFIWQASRMVIPAIGGLLIKFTGTWVLFAGSAVGFLVMMFTMLSIRVSFPLQNQEQSSMALMVEGVRYIRSTPLFRWLIGLTFVGMFFSNAYIQILPVFADMLAAGETGFGYLLSAGGIGSVVGTLLIGGQQHRPRLGHIMLTSAAAAVVALMLFACLVPVAPFWVAIVLMFATSAFHSVFLIISMTALQLSVPDALRGRVMGIHSIGFSLIPLGGLFLGAMAETYGAPAAVLLGNALYFVFIAWVWLSVRDVRSLDGTHFASHHLPSAAVDPASNAGRMR